MFLDYVGVSSFQVVQTFRLSHGKSQTFPIRAIMTNPDTGCATFEIHVVTTGRDLACTYSRRFLYANMLWRLKKGVAHGVVTVTNGDSDGMARFVCVVCAFGNNACGNAGYSICLRHMSLRLVC
jgi:hypothetical protein